MHSQWLWGIVLLGLSCLAWGQAEERPWVLVDTRAHRLEVRQGERAVAVFDHIAIGRAGVTLDKHAGDNRTPLGVFHIGWINRKSKYHLFFGLDYPSLPYARRGWRAGLIDDHTFRDMILASFENTVPPQDTPLGGYIGIHGLGRADPRIHRRFDWTRGCIALTNEEIERLARWVGVGTTVVIR